MPAIADEEAFLITGIGLMLVLSLWVLSLTARAGTMLRRLGEIVDPALWQSLGAPPDMKSALADPERRFIRFVRSGDYRRQCDDEAVELIDDFRQRTFRMLIIFAVAGGLLLFRFWPLLKPEFL